MQTTQDIEPIQSSHATVVWCRCCLEAGCPDHMRHVDQPVDCVVCGEQCQCAGCAANAEPSSEDD